MEEQPLVSIIIPVYNGSNYLSEAIDSALAQAYKNIEVIVVNDGSCDDGKTREIALSFNNSIRYFEKDNNGVSSALNYGLEKMEGEYFSWLSHDDQYYPWKIEKQINLISKLNNRKVVIFSHQNHINDAGLVIYRDDHYRYKKEKLALLLFYRYFIGGCSLLIPKAAFDEVGKFSEQYRYVQDYEMWFRMINSGYEFVYLPISTVMMRIHDEQDTVKNIESVCKEQTKLFSELHKWLKKEFWVLNSSGDPLFSYLYLSFQYKKNKQEELYKYYLNLSILKIKSAVFYKKILAVLFSIYIKNWNKYLDPGSYHRKFRALVCKFMKVYLHT